MQQYLAHQKIETAIRLFLVTFPESLCEWVAAYCADPLFSQYRCSEEHFCRRNLLPLSSFDGMRIFQTLSVCTHTWIRKVDVATLLACVLHIETDPTGDPPLVVVHHRNRTNWADFSVEAFALEKVLRARFKNAKISHVTNLPLSSPGSYFKHNPLEDLRNERQNLMNRLDVLNQVFDNG
jgi:hypothetical protein